MDIKKYFMLLPVALMAVACQDDKEPIKPTPEPAPGTEVQFGGSLKDDANSRTVYEPEDEDTKSFPIRWINNDLVYIYSPDVNSGRNQAIYKVSSTDEKIYEAGTFVKTGEAGIQWGTEPSARFFSVYPGKYVGDKQPSAKQVESTSGEKQTQFTLNMTNLQTCQYSAPESGKTEFQLDSVDRFGAIMYAKTPTKVANNTDVNLLYTPMATAIRVRLVGPTQANDVATISQIKLIAPKPIAGEFTATFTNTDDEKGKSNFPVVTPTANATTEITLYAQDGNDFLMLGNGQTADLNFFIIPTTTETITIDRTWKIQVIMSGYDPLEKSLGGVGNMTLEPGKVHRLPNLPALDLDDEWEVASWMRYVPRNVYLSEISIPGSWSSLNRNYQYGINSIRQQYPLGVRFFHLDTRYRGERNCNDDAMDLAIANGGSPNRIRKSWTKNSQEVMFYDDVSAFETYLDSILTNIANDEFAVILCTFAINSYQKDPDDKGTTSWTKDVSTFLKNRDKVLDARKFNSVFYYNPDDPSTYKYKDIKIDKNTTVGDVLGKAIVICGCDSTTEFSKLPADSKSLFVNMPLKRTADNFKSTTGFFDCNPFYTVAEGSRSKVDIWNNSCITQMTVRSGDPGPLVWISGRGYAPSLSQRKTVSGNVLNYWKNNYSLSSYTHNHWSIIGLGGYYVDDRWVLSTWSPGASDYTDIADNLNSWLNTNYLDAMTTSKYPVGWILFNRLNDATDSKSSIIKVLQLNNKFHKRYDPSKRPF